MRLPKLAIPLLLASLAAAASAARRPVDAPRPHAAEGRPLARAVDSWLPEAGGPDGDVSPAGAARLGQAWFALTAGHSH